MTPREWYRAIPKGIAASGADDSLDAIQIIIDELKHEDAQGKDAIAESLSNCILIRRVCVSAHKRHPQAPEHRSSFRPSENKG